MKRILVIQGGGRSNGNTAQLVESFIQGAEDAGHSVERISLLKNEVKGCLGCNACRLKVRTALFLRLLYISGRFHLRSKLSLKDFTVLQKKTRTRRLADMRDILSGIVRC